MISFILQLLEFEQCVALLKEVKRFASHLLITDDILNEQSMESIVRRLKGGKRMHLCHNYQRLLSDAGWQLDNTYHVNGVRYASGIILASVASGIR